MQYMRIGKQNKNTAREVSKIVRKQTNNDDNNQPEKTTSSNSNHAKEEVKRVSRDREERTKKRIATRDLHEDGRTEVENDDNQICRCREQRSGGGGTKRYGRNRNNRHPNCCSADHSCGALRRERRSLNLVIAATAFDPIDEQWRRHSQSQGSNADHESERCNERAWDEEAQNNKWAAAKTKRRQSSVPVAKMWAAATEMDGGDENGEGCNQNGDGGG